MKSSKTSLFWLLLIFVQLAYGAGGHSDKAKDKKILQLSQSLVKEELKDPFSTVFRKDAIYLDVSGNQTVCGEVNSKNSFGAYTGFQKYVVKLNYKKALFQNNASNGIEADDETWAVIVSNLCHKKLRTIEL